MKLAIALVLLVATILGAWILWRFNKAASYGGYSQPEPEPPAAEVDDPDEPDWLSEFVERRSAA